MNAGKFTLIKRTSPVGMTVGSVVTLVDVPHERILSAHEAINAVPHRAKVFGMVVCEDFPPALGEMERGESVMVAKAKDGSAYLYLLKVSDGVK
jgi:hypothetical protein